PPLRSIISMAPRPISPYGRFPLPEDSFPDDFVMISGVPNHNTSGFNNSFSVDTSRLEEKEVARPIPMIENLDPCKITDDERDLLQRYKRRQDAFKTALCDTYRRTGSCSYGDNCRFAHNQEELRVPNQPRGRMHPKYKTVLCENFERDGECKYGSRCMYIHRRRDEKMNGSFQYRPDVVSSSFHGQMPGLNSMDHRPPRHDKDRRPHHRPSSRGYGGPSSNGHNQTFSNFSNSFLQQSYGADVSLPHFIQDNSILLNSSSHEKLAQITRTAPSPTNLAELDGRKSRGSDDITARVGRMRVSERIPKQG
ncbi:hypothetical protein PFISCL1PPCAC_5838, partial [Pristionchus fissidentatus]